MTPDVERAIAELKRLVGLESAAMTYEVEQGHIRRFAEAIGDPNPLWTREVVARKSRYGGIIASPTFLRTCPAGSFPQPVRSPFARNLDAGSEWEYFEPVRLGDRITAQQQLAEVSERESRLGSMVTMARETRYVNQLGQLVAVQRSTVYSY